MKEWSEEKSEEEFGKYARNVTEDDVSGIGDKEEAVLGKAKGPLAKFVEDIKLLFSLVKDYASGAYREVPWKTIAAVIGTLIYIFSPIDAIPDFIPVVGLIDDAGVLAFCLAAIHSDLQEYKDWKGTV